MPNDIPVDNNMDKLSDAQKLIAQVTGEYQLLPVTDENVKIIDGLLAAFDVLHNTKNLMLLKALG